MTPEEKRASKRQQFWELKRLNDQGRLVPEKRKAMSPARKKRIWEAHNGICVQCGEPVEMRGPHVRYDHEIALELGGSDSDSNIGPIHRSPCDEIKTANDMRAIAKVRRIEKRETEGPKPSRLQSAGFRRDITKHMNGTVTARKERS